MTYLAGAVLALSTAWLIYHISVRRQASQTSLQSDTRGQDSAKESEPPKVQLSNADESEETTGRAQAGGIRLDVAETHVVESVPSFTLTNIGNGQDAAGAVGLAQLESTDRSSSAGSKTSNSTPSSNPVATMMPPPPKPSTSSLSPLPRLKPPAFSSSPNRMAPPPRPSGGGLRPPPSPAANLRRSPQSNLLSASTLPANGQPSSRAVVLSPGHSPLDWASLTQNPKATRTLRGLAASGLSTTLFSSPHTFLRIPPSTLRRFNGRKGRDAWTTYNGKVYNLTAYLPFHPGGEPEILKGAGRGSDKLFAEVHPWVNWDGMLSECCVGILVGEEDERAVKVDREGKLIVESAAVCINHLDEMD